MLKGSRSDQHEPELSLASDSLFIYLSLFGCYFGSMVRSNCLSMRNKWQAQTLSARRGRQALEMASDLDEDRRFKFPRDFSDQYHF